MEEEAFPANSNSKIQDGRQSEVGARFFPFSLHSQPASSSSFSPSLADATRGLCNV